MKPTFVIVETYPKAFGKDATSLLALKSSSNKNIHTKPFYLLTTYWFFPRKYANH